MSNTEAVLHPCWRFRADKNGEVEKHLFADIGDVPEKEGWQDSPAKVESPKVKTKQIEASVTPAAATWPPSEEAIAGMSHKALGDLLKAKGVATLPRAEGDRRKALRDLISKAQ